MVANSALMFGYPRPEWRDGWAGWEYLDAVADDNERRRALAADDRALAAAPVTCALVDIGRLAAEAIARADHLTRDGIRDALERVKRLPAACGYEGTTMGFGVYDHGALAGEYLVLREWRDGRTVQVARLRGRARSSPLPPWPFRLSHPRDPLVASGVRPGETRETTMAITSLQASGAAPAVCWEPCHEFHDGGALERPDVCAACGWPPDDHGLEAAA